MPRKSKGRKARKALLDVILVEVRGVRPPARQGWRAWLAPQLPHISVVASVGRQRRHFSARPPESGAVVWNEDATFTWTALEEANEDLRLRLKVEAEGAAVAEGFLGLAGLAGPVADLWLPLAPLPPAGGALDAAQAAAQADVAAHLLLQRCSGGQAGLLAHLGRPSAALPLRLQAGDVVLVSSSHPLTYGVKAASWSTWDHVALVVQLPGRRSLHLFEATMEGVAAYRLDEALATYLESSDLAVRRLRAARTEEMLQQLAAFVQQVRGRPYNASPWFLLRSGLGSHDAASDDDPASLFCSQLVGLALKRMGLLPPGLAASNLLPAHFAAAPAVAGGDAGQAQAQALAGLLAPAALVPRPPPAAEARAAPPPAACPAAHVLDARIVAADEARGADGRRFTAYTLEVRGRAGVHVVRRRYSQFAALHGRMKELFRGVPRLPPKTLGRGTSASVVQTRQRALQIYLEVLLDDRLTRTAPPLLRFLGPGPLEPSLAHSAPALVPTHPQEAHGPEAAREEATAAAAPAAVEEEATAAAAPAAEEEEATAAAAPAAEEEEATAAAAPATVEEEATAAAAPATVEEEEAAAAAAPAAVEEGARGSSVPAAAGAAEAVAEGGATTGEATHAGAALSPTSGAEESDASEVAELQRASLEEVAMRGPVELAAGDAVQERQVEAATPATPAVPCEAGAPAQEAGSPPGARQQANGRGPKGTGAGHALAHAGHGRDGPAPQVATGAA